MMNRNEELFQKNLIYHGCGYYSVCIEHACSCRASNDIELNPKTWQSMIDEAREEMDEYYEDYDDFDDCDDFDDESLTMQMIGDDDEE